MCPCVTHSRAAPKTRQGPTSLELELETLLATNPFLCAGTGTPTSGAGGGGQDEEEEGRAAAVAARGREQPW